MQTESGQWHQRTIDVSIYAGLVVNRFLLLNERNGSTGQFDLYFADMSLVRADGSVVPVWSGSSAPSSLAATVFGPGSVNHAAVDGAAPQGVDSSFAGTHYYLDDHLGTAQMELTSGGWPTWQGQFTPFGQEIIGGKTTNYIGQQPADGTSMRFKFTGKERDSESGLDNFGARYMSSSMGRFMSPDYSDGPDPVPFGDLSDPQSLNLYSYVQNNPLNSIDEDGHLDCSGGAVPDVACAVTAAAKAVWNFLKGDNSSVTTSQTITVPTPAAPGVPEGGPGTATGPLIEAQDAARANPRFQPIPGGSTFCNMASCSIGQHAGSNMGPLMTNGVPNLANTDASTLAHSGSYHRVGPAEAQRLANMGKVVYGVYKEPGHGHIITVRPDNGPYTGSGSPSTGPNDPIINDIGRHIGVYPLSQQPSAGFRSGVICYAPN